MYATPTADFDAFDTPYSNVPRNAAGRVAGDEPLIVKFYKKAVLSQLKSKEEGRQIFDELDHVQIKVPGDKHLLIDTVATDEYRVRFPNEWKRYLENEASVESGTPIESWSLIGPAQAAELRAMNVHSIEALASLPDGYAARLPGGGHSLRQKAQAWLKANTDANALANAEARVAELEKQLAAKGASKTKE